MVQLHMLHDVSDVALSGILFHVEKIAVQTAPEQWIFLAVYFSGMKQLSCVYLDIARVEGIAEIH